MSALEFNLRYSTRKAAATRDTGILADEDHPSLFKIEHSRGERAGEEYGCPQLQCPYARGFFWRTTGSLQSSKRRQRPYLVRKLPVTGRGPMWLQVLPGRRFILGRNCPCF